MTDSPLQAETPRALFGDAVDAQKDLRRAYAALIRTWRPDTHADEFRHVRRLYEEALARLERKDTPATPPVAEAEPGPTQSVPTAPDGSWAAWEAREGSLFKHDPAAWARGLRQALRAHGWELPAETLSALVDRVGMVIDLPDEAADALWRQLCGLLAWQAAARDPAAAGLAAQVRAALQVTGADRLKGLMGVRLEPEMVRRHPGLAALVYEAVDQVTGRSKWLRAWHRGQPRPKQAPAFVLDKLSKPRERLVAFERLQRRDLRDRLASQRSLGCVVVPTILGAAFCVGRNFPEITLILMILATPFLAMGYRAWWKETELAAPGPGPADADAIAEARAEEKQAVFEICRRHRLWLHELAGTTQDCVDETLDALLDDPLSDLLVAGEAHLGRPDLDGGT